MLNALISHMDFADNSPNTKKSYMTYSKAFLEYCNSTLEKDPLEVTYLEIRRFLSFIQKERDLKNRTINHAISEIKLLLCASGYNWNDILVPRKNFVSPTLYVPTKSTVQELINSVTNPKKKAMVSIMYGTGARVSETCKLKCSDIHKQKMYIHIVEGKGGRGRDVPLPSITYQHIEKYWRLLPPEKKTRDWLFTQERNLMKPADTEYIQKFLKKHTSSWENQITAHTLRRAFATHAYIDGISIEKISTILGHKSIQSTLIYVHLGEALMAQSIKCPIDDLDLLV